MRENLDKTLAELSDHYQYDRNYGEKMLSAITICYLRISFGVCAVDISGARKHHNPDSLSIS
jgi:hypothetical protein